MKAGMHVDCCYLRARMFYSQASRSRLTLDGQCATCLVPRLWRAGPGCCWGGSDGPPPAAAAAAAAAPLPPPLAIATGGGSGGPGTGPQAPPTGAGVDTGTAWGASEAVPGSGAPAAAHPPRAAP